MLHWGTMMLRMEPLPASSMAPVLSQPFGHFLGCLLPLDL